MNLGFELDLYLRRLAELDRLCDACLSIGPLPGFSQEEIVRRVSALREVVDAFMSVNMDTRLSPASSLARFRSLDSAMLAALALVGELADA